MNYDLVYFLGNEERKIKVCINVQHKWNFKYFSLRLVGPLVIRTSIEWHVKEPLASTCSSWNKTIPSRRPPHSALINFSYPLVLFWTFIMIFRHRIMKCFPPHGRKVDVFIPIAVLAGACILHHYCILANNDQHSCPKTLEDMNVVYALLTLTFIVWDL